MLYISKFLLLAFFVFVASSNLVVTTDTPQTTQLPVDTTSTRALLTTLSPTTLSPTTPSTTLSPTTPSPTVSGYGNCTSISDWGGLTLGFRKNCEEVRPCMSLIETFSNTPGNERPNGYRSCSLFCNERGLRCEYVYEELHDTCEINTDHATFGCDDDVGLITEDILCQCMEITADRVEGTCDNEDWPTHKSYEQGGFKICNDCTALIHTRGFKTVYPTCNDFCKHLGLDCDHAREELSNSCNPDPIGPYFKCDEDISETTSDALCKCKEIIPDCSDKVNLPVLYSNYSQCPFQNGTMGLFEDFKASGCNKAAFTEEKFREMCNCIVFLPEYSLAMVNEEGFDDGFICKLNDTSSSACFPTNFNTTSEGTWTIQDFYRQHCQQNDSMYLPSHAVTANNIQYQNGTRWYERITNGECVRPVTMQESCLDDVKALGGLGNVSRNCDCLKIAYYNGGVYNTFPMIINDTNKPKGCFFDTQPLECSNPGGCGEQSFYYFNEADTGKEQIGSTPICFNLFPESCPEEDSIVSSRPRWDADGNPQWGELSFCIAVTLIILLWDIYLLYFYYRVDVNSNERNLQAEKEMENEEPALEINPRISDQKLAEAYTTSQTSWDINIDGEITENSHASSPQPGLKDKDVPSKPAGEQKQQDSNEEIDAPDTKEPSRRPSQKSKQLDNELEKMHSKREPETSKENPGVANMSEKAL